MENTHRRCMGTAISHNTFSLKFQPHEVGEAVQPEFKGNPSWLGLRPPRNSSCLAMYFYYAFSLFPQIIIFDKFSVLNFSDNEFNFIEKSVNSPISFKSAVFVSL
jgi:hypothetical protein